MYTKGRGAISNRESRYMATRKVCDDDGETPSVVTECSAEVAKSIITRNRSPDIPFEQSLNPYRGCEHGCIYCYARPTHAWLDLSPGLDFETRLRYKQNAAEQLAKELSAPGYVCKPIVIGANTDPYQPVEKKHRVTRAVLEVLQAHRHPFFIITKSNLVLRDLDILTEMAAHRLCSVAVSVTTLNRQLKRAMEPRTPTGEERLRCVSALAEAGIPVSVMVAPVIPALNDMEIETILKQAAAAGAGAASYILLRLPLEISELFQEWLQQHYPQRAEHVMSLVRQCRGGRDNDPRFSHRMRGTGEFADLIEQRFKLACRRLRLNQRRHANVDCGLFQIPARAGAQLSLF